MNINTKLMYITEKIYHKIYNKTYYMINKTIKEGKKSKRNKIHSIIIDDD